MSAAMLRQIKKSYVSALKDFAASTSAFRVLRTVPPAAPTIAKTLYVLDSSFNPPSKMHLQIATSALRSEGGATPHRLLLLLATQNADKAPKPASFEDRLVMMTSFAQEVLYELGSHGQEGQPAIDIGVTKEPYFHKKATAIEESKFYPKQPEQVHLTGFDTIIRIFDTKYYPPDHNFGPLEPFLSKHRLRVTCRPDDEWGGRAQQEQYVKDIGDGKRESEGAKREWADKIKLVEGKKEEEAVVSSTLARRAAKDDHRSLEKYATPTVRDWIKSEGLYLE